MPHKPLRQLAAEKAHGNKPENPSQLGDPIDLKAETTEDSPDESPAPSGGVAGGHGSNYGVKGAQRPSASGGEKVEGSGDRGTDLAVPRSALEGDPDAQGEEKGTVIGIGEGAGPVGGVRKRGSKL